MQDLTTTLTQLGFTLTTEGDRTRIAYKGVHGQHLIPPQSCEAALLVLSARCDHAHTHDGAGFSKYDAEFGHDLANNVRRYGRLTEKQLRMVQRNEEKKRGLVVKYQKQLARLGFDMEQLLDQDPIPAPEKPAKPAGEPEAFTFKASVVKETEKALRLAVAAKGDGVVIWVPRAFTKIEGDQFTIPYWKAKQEKLVALLGSAA